MLRTTIARAFSIAIGEPYVRRYLAELAALLSAQTLIDPPVARAEALERRQMTVSGLNLRGLSQAEAQQRLAANGPNSLPEAKSISLWQRLLSQFKSALIYILLFALALDLALWLHEGAKQIPFESIAIGLILVLNAGLGAYQESKAEEALARLKALAKPSVWVKRDGALVQIPANDLVPDDIARVEAGDRVPADGRLIEGQGVMADESILTGESLPIDKELWSEVFSGTLIVRGKGYIEVTRTGPKSTMGQLATMIGGIEAGKTPLERRLGEFGNQVAIAILAVGLALTVGGLVVEGIGRLGQVVLFSVALAVAAVPEGLPAVLTLTLAMGVERLARRKAIVRRLSAVEALGSVTVIATDKTGTLTENRMHVRAIDAPDADRALHAMVLANDAEMATGAGIRSRWRSWTMPPAAAPIRRCRGEKAKALEPAFRQRAPSSCE